MTRSGFALLFCFLTAAFAPMAKPAGATEYSHIRIVRLSFVEGQVQYQRGSEGWQAAATNLPIEQGFSIQTQAGFAEVEFENGLMLRLAQNSAVQFTELALVDGARTTHLDLARGTAIVTASLSHGEVLSLSAANMKLSIPHSGNFRVDVDASGAWVTALHGNIDVEAASGVTELAKGHTLGEDSTGSAPPEIAKNPAPDAFDKWVNQREQVRQIASADATDNLSSHGYTTGFADLQEFGEWYNLPGYGVAWQPFGVGPGWMPFMDGQWSFMSDMGWTWMSGEPWGWLPYHYGGWVDLPGQGWLWVPGNQQMWQAWQPGTANWVNLGGQTGWVPLTAVPAKPVKNPANGLPRTNQVILASAAGSGNVIRAGARMIVDGPKGLSAASAPPPALQWTHSAARVATSSAVASSVTAGQAGPARLQAPQFVSTPHSNFVAARPVSQQAPHSAPVAAGAFAAYRSGYNRGANYAGPSPAMSNSGMSRTAGPPVTAASSPMAAHSGSASASSTAVRH